MAGVGLQSGQDIAKALTEGSHAHSSSTRKRFFAKKQDKTAGSYVVSLKKIVSLISWCIAVTCRLLQTQKFNTMLKTPQLYFGGLDTSLRGYKAVENSVLSCLLARNHFASKRRGCDLTSLAHKFCERTSQAHFVLLMVR